MFFIIPGGNARQLVVYGHGTAVVGAVFEVAFEDIGIAGHETGPQARQVATLRQAVEHDAAGEIVAANSSTGLQQSFRRLAFVGVEFGIAFIGRDDEIMLVRQFDDPHQRLPGNHRTAGIAR